MAKWSIAAGVPTSIWLGINDPSTISPPLKKVFARPTGGIVIEETLDRPYISSENTRVQSGFHQVTVSMAFLGEEDIIWKLVRDLDPIDDINNQPRTDVHYAMLLLYANSKEKKSFWFPDLQVDGPLTINYNKDRATILPIKFIAVNRDPSVLLMARDTYPALLEQWKFPELQERSPF